MEDNLTSIEKKNILNFNNNQQDKVCNIKENKFNVNSIKNDLENLNKNFNVKSLNNINEFMDKINNNSGMLEMDIDDQ